MGSKIWRAALLIAALCIVLPAALFAADRDPLKDTRKYRIVPKHRLNLMYRGTDWAMRSILGSNESVASGVDLPSGEIRSVSVSDFGYSNGSSNYVFASATAEGIISSKQTISPDFYGVTVFENVPEPVTVNSYIVKDGNNASVHLEMVTNASRGGKRSVKKLSLSPKPSYLVLYKTDVVWKDNECPPLDKNTMHDLVGYDWNGDGYTDYLFTYIGCTDSERKNPKAVLVLVDGKSLYDSMNTSASPKIYYVNGTSGSAFSTGENVVGGRTDVKPANSYRMVIGDFDGDGVPEAAIAFTKVHGAAAGKGRANQLEIYKISKAGESYSFARVFEDGEAGSSFMQNDSLGLAAGDINGDGLDELVLLYARTELLYENSKIHMNIYKDYSRVIEKEILSSTGYSVTQEKTSVPPINAALEDLDGDGFAELVWVTGTEKDGLQLTMFVHKWPGGVLSDSGKQYTYNLNSYGWQINGNYKKHSLALGYFNYPDPDKAYVKQPKLIAVAQMGGNSSGVSDTANIDWGIFSWGVDGAGNPKLELLGKGLLIGKQKDGNLGPVIAAADTERESLVLGAPETISVNDNMELLMVAQAPPKHWDKVHVGSEESVLDAFSVFPNGYNTSMISNSSTESAEIVTDISKGTWGAEFSYTLKERVSLKEKVFNNNQKMDDPLLKIGAKYSGNYAHNTTDTEATKFSYNFTFEADRDDQLYYRANNYTICRYPVIFPETKRLSSVTDDSGQRFEAQNYIQIIVPEEIATTFTPAAGRSISWYEPLHDNYNLFTYPKRLSDIRGYPQGSEEKKKINPEDPYIDINGKVFISGNDNQIGNPDPSSFKMDVTNSSSHKELDSITHTMGGYIFYHPTFGLIDEDRHKLCFDLQGDGTWGTDTTTTVDASKTIGVKMSWPGAKNYNAYNTNLSAADMQFNSDIAYFAQDDGAIAVGYAVSSLQNYGSKIWGTDSPYGKYPDPGLLLPLRWDNDLRVDSGGKYIMSPNTDSYKKNRLRGVVFEKSDGSSAVAADKNGLPVRLFEQGENYKGAIRIINYSFKPVDRPLKVKFYYQKNANPQGIDTPSESASGLELFDEKTVSAIPGRTARQDQADNWIYVPFDWSKITSKKKEDEIGYLHVFLEYEGTQLNADNDHGHVLVGFYNPDDFEDLVLTDSMKSALANGPAAEDLPDIEIKDVVAREILQDGTLGEATGFDVNRKMEIGLTAAFTGGKIQTPGGSKEIKYLPLLRMGLFSSNTDKGYALLAAEEVPILKDGQSVKLSFTYDPNVVRGTGNSIFVKAFSPFLPSDMQRDSDSNSSYLYKHSAGGGDSSGGCTAAPLSAIALFAAAAVIAVRKRGGFTKR